MIENEYGQRLITAEDIDIDEVWKDEDVIFLILYNFGDCTLRVNYKAFSEMLNVLENATLNESMICETLSIQNCWDMPFLSFGVHNDSCGFHIRQYSSWDELPKIATKLKQQFKKQCSKY